MTSPGQINIPMLNQKLTVDHIIAGGATAANVLSLPVSLTL